MLIDLENRNIADMFFVYLEENTTYEWMSGHTPTSWWNAMSDYDKDYTIKWSLLSLDVAEKNKLFFFSKNQSVIDTRLQQERYITAREYLKSISQGLIILNREVEK